MPLSTTNRKWLRSLTSKLFRELEPDRFGRTQLWPREVILSARHVKHIRDLVTKHSLVCVLDGGLFGDIGITIFEPPEVPGVALSFLCSIREDHIAGLKDDRSRGNGSVGTEVWKFFHDGFVDTPRNLELLELYGLPKPGAIDSYDY